MKFEDVLTETLFQIREVLAQKADEYASSKSRYHNFEAGGRKRNCTPEEALMGMKLKHDVAVDDLVDWVKESPEKLTLPMINEKIGDSINYLILLKGMLINRVEAYAAQGESIVKGA
jgi:hypothetical protein